MLKKINQLGLPYHGLVADGMLTLQNGVMHPYAELNHGDTQCVRTMEPRSNAGSEHDWRDYAIVADNHLGAFYLGLNWLLYVDPQYTVWYLTIEYRAIWNDCHIECVLCNIFGRFDKQYASINRSLVQQEIILHRYGRLLPLNRFTFERKPDGSEVLIHVYADFYSNNVIEFPEGMTLYEVWRLSLSGVGSLEQDSLGDGITAELVQYRNDLAINRAETFNVPRSDRRCRVAKINIVYEYDPAPAEPPLCSTNTCRSTFDLAMVDAEENFTPFDQDRNVYIQSNWYGTVNKTESIVRCLYNDRGSISCIKVRMEKEKVKRIFNDFSGSGCGTQGPIYYFFRNGTCIVNGRMPGWVESYQGRQSVLVQNKTTEKSTIFVDDEVVETLTLEGIVTQSTETVMGSPPISRHTVTVRLNDSTLRNVVGTPGQLSTVLMRDPFSGSYDGDHYFGVFTKFHYGLVSNNLVGHFVTRYGSSDNFMIKQRESHSVIGIHARQFRILYHLHDFCLYATQEPVQHHIARSEHGKQCWV